MHSRQNTLASNSTSNSSVHFTKLIKKICNFLLQLKVIQMPERITQGPSNSNVVERGIIGKLFVARRKGGTLPIDRCLQAEYLWDDLKGPLKNSPMFALILCACLSHLVTNNFLPFGLVFDFATYILRGTFLGSENWSKSDKRNLDLRKIVRDH